MIVSAIHKSRIIIVGLGEHNRELIVTWVEESPEKWAKRIIPTKVNEALDV
jgi:hypothetical protein